ncbi:hypothetical protein LCGC14_1101300 [marine sediment metagenome]|uniref:Uncharacterized protein n=1 Tax=marine sediment metagenome TaxID=412755 RepID=A0A0F9QFJ4_9ZZZZ
MNKPSSTITAATLAGMGATLFWELFMQFNFIGPVRPALIAGSVTFIVALVGYLKKENVLPLK